MSMKVDPDRKLKVRDILPYFQCDCEIIQVIVSGGNWDAYDEFSASSSLLKELGDWTITEMSCIQADVLRIEVRKDEVDGSKT